MRTTSIPNLVQTLASFFHSPQQQSQTPARIPQRAVMPFPVRTLEGRIPDFTTFVPPTHFVPRGTYLDIRI